MLRLMRALLVRLGRKRLGKDGVGLVDGVSKLLRQDGRWWLDLSPKGLDLRQVLRRRQGGARGGVTPVASCDGRYGHNGAPRHVVVYREGAALVLHVLLHVG